ncbi:MAG: hypothetical protein L6R36_008967 [Xanthoria steineri]|nr:MAG: hypothetical protein L6R36_008967 [Xanthoria steineri]
MKWERELSMDWQRELAKRCEVELEEIERLCRKCEDIEEWRTPHDARDDWRDGPRTTRHVFALVIVFPKEFSLLRCLERESRKIDNLITEIDDTGGSATRLPNHPTDDAAGNDTYDLSYFRQDYYRWSVRFKAWRSNLSATETSTGATEKERLVAAVTGDFALLYYLQEALRESSELWHEWGPDAFYIIDGIKARIEALHYVKEQAPNPGDVIHPSIKELLEEIREKGSLTSQEHATLRRRRRINPGSIEDREVQIVHPEETKKDHPPRPDVESNLKQARTVLFQLHSKIRRFCLTTTKIEWIPKTSVRRLLKSANLFTIIAVGAFVSSTWLVSLSITTNMPIWAGFAQMVLYVFQAFAALESRIKTRKPSEEDKYRFNNLRRTSAFFCIVITAGALAATVAAVIYPYYPLVSTGLSFGANLCQVVGTISVSNAIGV